MNKKSFGHLSDGKEVFEFTLINKAGMQVRVINFGGIITSILVPDRNGNWGDVVLGFDSLEGYIIDNHYIGALVGRNANRISGAAFLLDGILYPLAKNNGNCNLHGGITGFNKVFWDIEPIQQNEKQSLKLTYLSQDGEEGFPGNLLTEVIYTLTEDNSLQVEYSAATDKSTVVNLTQHSYFNLSAGNQKDILSHDLQLFATYFLPTAEEQLPTGELKSVAGTVFDFTQPKQIGRDIQLPDEQLIAGKGYDHTWVIDHERESVISKACCLSDAISGRKLEIFTTEPGIQVYTGNYLNGSGDGKNGESYTYRYGIGLETQRFPNSVNMPGFSSVRLNPGERYQSKTIFKFSVINS